MKVDTCIIIRKPEVVALKNKEGKVFGDAEEITSKKLGAERANLSKITLWGPDILHYHKKGEETYICQKGKGEIFLNDRICSFSPGSRVIIKPGTIHAARPKNQEENLVFLCLSSPAFDPEDVYNDPRGQNW